MAEFKLGRIRFVWKGDWTADAVYFQDDVVAFGGKTYICVLGHTSQTNFFSDLDIVPPKWNLMSEGQDWKGEWQPDTAYVYDDIVSYGARLYIANENHTSASTAVDATDGLEADLSKWDAFAEGLDWKDDWTTDTRYRINDFVKYGGATYVCNTLHVSASTASDGLETDIANWDVFNQGIEYKGEWTSGTRYKLNDLVRYGAGVWICTEYHTATDTPGNDGDKWSKFVEGFQYENDWSPFRAYQSGDVVRYGGNQYISKTSNTEIVPASSSASNRTFVVTVAQNAQSPGNNVYVIDGVQYPDLQFTTGYTYTFDQNDSSNVTHPLNFSSTQNGTHGGGTAFENNVSYFLDDSAVADAAAYNAGFTAATTRRVEISVTEDTPNPLYYYCYNHSGMSVNAEILISSSSDWDLFTEGFRFIGDWNEDSANTHYKVGEVVRLGGFTYVCVKDHEAAQQPPDAEFWKLVNEGFRWRGEWLDDQEYYEGDVVQYGDNTYYCNLYHISEGDDYSTETTTEPGGGAEGSRPDLADSGAYWSILAVGTEQSVLTTTGDLVYYSGSAPIRLPIGKAGQVLRVDDAGLPSWEFLQSVEDIYYVAEHGQDLPYPEYGSTIDRPFKTIRYAAEQIERGPKNPNAQYLLELNRSFVQREVTAYIRDQVDNATGGSIWENFTYDTVKCERDVGFVIDRIIHDLGQGGNLKIRAAAQSFLGVLGDGPFSIASEQEGSGFYSNLGDESDQSVAAYQYMLELLGNVLANEVPDVVYQNATDDSTAIIDQYINTNLQAEATALPRVTELANIIITVIDSGDTADIPERVVPQTLVKVSTGIHYEILPIIVPANCAIMGDELRSTKIVAQGAVTPETDTANTVATFDRIAEVVKDVVTGTSVTPTTGNNEAQFTDWPHAISTQADAVEELIYMIKYQIDYNLNGMTARRITDPVGYEDSSLEYARDNLETNRKFLIEETVAYMNSEYPNLRYSQTKLRRNAGYVLDALRYDLTYGGNALSVQAGLAYYDGDDDTQPVLDSSIKAEYIAAFNYLKTTAQSVAGNTTVVNPEQTTVTQTLTGNTGSITEIANNVEDLIDILDNGPDAVGTTTTLVDPTPANGVNSTTALIAAYSDLDTNASTIRSSTISWINSNFPNLTYDTAKCSRDIGIILKAVGFDFMFDSNYQTLKAAHAYLRETASEVYTLNQKAVTRAAIGYALKTLAVANVNSDATAIARVEASADIIDSVIYGATNEGSVCQSEDQNVYYAQLQLERNREFVKSEVSAWIDNQISTATAGSIWENYTYDEALCMRDVDLYIDALKYDLKHPGNYTSRYVSRYYSNAVTGSQEEDMFYLRDATGVRNCTVNGLSGDLEPANTFGTSRPTAGAYCSLDPGWGPDDFTTWIITRSPYVQGVTTFGTAATGQKIDGALHNGGNDSIVSNDFTQVISDGIGAHILNNGRAELVSVFSYYAHIGYLAEAGGRIRATNGNNSYGDFGSVAEGVDPDETPVTAVVDNRTQYNATISEVVIDNDKLLSIEYNHAGNDYTEAGINVFGPGDNEVIVADEFRDNALNFVLVDQDADPDVPIGGSGYIRTSNVAQSGSTTGIFLSATDGALSTAYPGMKIYITGGAAVGQYAIVNTYNAGSKEATVVRESDGVAGWDHVVAGTPIVAPNSSSTYQIEPIVSITAPPQSNASITLPTSTTWYDVKYVKTTAQYTAVSTTTSGTGTGLTFDVTRNDSKYYLTVNSAGTEYARLDTATLAGTDLDGASTLNDVVVTITSVNSVTGAVVDFDFTGLGRAGQFLAVGAGTNGALSVDGETWSAETLPTLTGGNWNSIASGLQNDGSSLFQQSAVIIVADGSNDVAYSDDADTWTSTALPAGISTAGAKKITYGNIVGSVIDRFVVIADDDTDVAYSNNGGVTWDIESAALPNTGFTSITYGTGKFVTIASGSTDAAYSLDGISWTGVTLPANAGSDVVWGNGKFVTLGGANGIMYSLDGITWYENALTLPLTATERKLAYGQGTFVITSDDTNEVQYSQDGLYWQSYTLSTTIAGGYNAIAFGNPARDGRFVILPNSAGTGGVYAKLGATARGRASVSNEQVFEIRITEPGSGYATAPTATVTDPNNIDDVVLVPQLGDGVLANPTFVNRGTGFVSATAEVDDDASNGNADFPQSGTFIAVRRMTQRPVNGANVEFASLPGEFYKLVNIVSFLGTNDGNFTGFLQISPGIAVEDTLPDGDAVEMRIRFSQVRLTGHDFLDIGTGNFTSTNYPNTPLQQPVQAQETRDRDGGRVFYTATDQDGNFRVGDLFTIEQSTGVATLNADAFNIAGLQELSLGEVTLGGNSASITEFSTDPFFTANSDTVVPTQRAVKAYIEAQIGGGGASLNVNSVTAGDIFVGGDTITTLSGSTLNIRANVVFSGTVLGLPLAYNYFLR